jgi:hypothetical protein
MHDLKTCASASVEGIRHATRVARSGLKMENQHSLTDAFGGKRRSPTTLDATSGSA